VVLAAKGEAKEELALEKRPPDHGRASEPGSVPATRRGDALDVSELPSYGFSHRSLMWWGNAGMMAIEGTAFGLMILIYFYLRSLSTTPGASPTPGLLWGTVNLAIILASAIPNVLTDKAAIEHDLGKVRIGLIVCSVFGLALCGVRALEFTTLNVRWDDSAYGSFIWTFLVCTPSPRDRLDRHARPHRVMFKKPSRANASSILRKIPGTGIQSC
jgi:hypothetical protein